MLEPVSRACVRCAFTLYRGILDEIEAADYDVLHRRVAVPNRRRAAVRRSPAARPGPCVARALARSGALVDAPLRTPAQNAIAWARRLTSRWPAGAQRRDRACRAASRPRRTASAGCPGRRSRRRAAR